MKKESLWKIVTTLSVMGLVLAAYLMYQYLKPAYGGICNINDRFNCLPTTKGELKNFLGIPVPVIGGIGYGVILVSSLLRKPKLLFAMAAFGTLFCLRITFLEVFVVKVICPVCIICQIVMLAVFVCSLVLLKRPESSASPSDTIES